MWGFLFVYLGQNKLLQLLFLTDVFVLDRVVYIIKIKKILALFLIVFTIQMLRYLLIIIHDRFTPVVAKAILIFDLLRLKVMSVAGWHLLGLYRHWVLAYDHLGEGLVLLLVETKRLSVLVEHRWFLGTRKTLKLVVRVEIEILLRLWVNLSQIPLPLILKRTRITTFSIQVIVIMWEIIYFKLRIIKLIHFWSLRF